MLLSGRVARTLAPLALSFALTLGLSTLARAQVLDAPDPGQMEDAPPLGYTAVPHGLQIPANIEMGTPSSVAWTPKNTLLIFNRGPHPLLEFNPDGSSIRAFGEGEYVTGPTGCVSTPRATSGRPTSTDTR